MTKKSKSNKDNNNDNDVIRPGAPLNVIFNRNLIWLFSVGTLFSTIMVALINS